MIMLKIKKKNRIFDSFWHFISFYLFHKIAIYYHYYYFDKQKTVKILLSLSFHTLGTSTEKKIMSIYSTGEYYRCL